MLHSTYIHPDPLYPFNYSEWAEVIPLGAEDDMQPQEMDEQTQRDNEFDVFPIGGQQKDADTTQHAQLELASLVGPSRPRGC